MPYNPYKTAQGWKNKLGNLTDQDTQVSIDLLGALTPTDPYVPYNTPTGWQQPAISNSGQTQLLVNIDTYGAA